MTILDVDFFVPDLVEIENFPVCDKDAVLEKLPDLFDQDTFLMRRFKFFRCEMVHLEEILVKIFPKDAVPLEAGEGQNRIPHFFIRHLNAQFIGLMDDDHPGNDAADSDGTIAKVEFYQGATKLVEDTTAPYGYTWSSVAAGTYSLTVKATDNGGAATTSAGSASR